ncbi:serine hydrolase domain-containing protein [Pedobacter nototheniae]|uniref:serine hydrolase domain-containing protein n=1 Tax=Pedobacter nototheniae TaxID=2488994 RepID=UPI00292E234F|nr:serine hydrolase domain-containing protein [Pedobacter nototheniae]
MIRKIIVFSLMTVFAATCFSQTLNKQRLDSLFTVLKENDKFMGSIAISKDGKLLYSNAIGYSDVDLSKKADPKTQYRIGSVSKMFTAVLVLKAVEENKIQLKQTLDPYFPQIENANKITIENLLNHRSGIHNFTSDKLYLDYHTEPKSEKEMVEIIAKGKSDFEPNSKAQYSNSNYVLLSYILEKIYSKPYAKILDAKIINPLSLMNTHSGGKTNSDKNESFSYAFDDKWIKEDETDLSVPMGAGAIVSTPRDLTIFIEQLFAGKIITNHSLTLMKTMNEKFGLGMFEFTYAGNTGYGHTGGIDKFQSVLWYFPKEKLSVALISNGMIYSIDQVLQGALSSYFNQTFEMPTFKSIVLKAAELDQFLGTYASAQMPVKIIITKNNDKLLAQATGQAAIVLDATAPNVFQFEKFGIVMEFIKDKKQVVLKQSGKELLFTKE